MISQIIKNQRRKAGPLDLKNMNLPRRFWDFSISDLGLDQISVEYGDSVVDKFLRSKRDDVFRVISGPRRDYVATYICRKSFSCFAQVRRLDCLSIELQTSDREYKECDVLWLDNLESVSVKDWISLRIIEKVLRHRHQSGDIILITCSELSGLEKFLSNKLIRGIVEECTLIPT